MSDNQINDTTSTNQDLVNGDNDTTIVKKKNTYNREYYQTHKGGYRRAIKNID